MTILYGIAITFKSFERAMNSATEKHECTLHLDENKGARLCHICIQNEEYTNCLILKAFRAMTLHDSQNCMINVSQQYYLAIVHYSTSSFYVVVDTVLLPVTSNFVK